MNVSPTSLPGVLLIQRPVFPDERGYFSKVLHAREYAAAGIKGVFVQQNVSYSHHGVLRGLHFQHPEGQGKLVTVLSGEVLDVCVDVRIGSPTFGRWIAETLSEGNGKQLFIPVGFAHGFLVTGAHALMCYGTSGYWAPACERTIRWSDPQIGLPWAVASPVLSSKDAVAPTLSEAHDLGFLPTWQA